MIQANREMNEKKKTPCHHFAVGSKLPRSMSSSQTDFEVLCKIPVGGSFFPKLLELRRQLEALTKLLVRDFRSALIEERGVC
jgi:hypothetical protein